MKNVHHCMWEITKINDELNTVQQKIKKHLTQI